MIGKILGNRYQIVEKIGDGGTAFVFKGMDNLLNRHVTVKVLRPEYVSDQDFVRRFRREAQAAASLSHPNIVSIYDVGYEEGIHYIVMEYIQGHSLKELINDMGHLPLRMAVDYTCQIAQALNNAHKHGIIHRDVKPHNILISDDGRVKVTDFGIAQAVTASTVTYTGAILGSVHYFSPEQAKGGATDEKSDIYSLGVMLFEMLTGHVPFRGDSPVSIAVKHLQEPFPNPRELNSEIPESISRIILKAVEKDPEKRYRTAREMSEELSAWLLGKDVRQTDPGPKHFGPKTPPKKAQKKFTFWHYAAIATAALALTLILFGLFRIRNYFIVPNVEVPSVEGESLARATDILENAGLRPRVESQQPSDTVPIGHVIQQTPAAGRVVKKTREIDLVLSTGPELVELPNVVGKMRREAELILRGDGFEVDFGERFGDQPVGTVIEQSPSGGVQIAKGAKVRLVISAGGQPVKIPDFTGRTLDDVRALIEWYGLELRHVEERYSDRYAAGVVMGQFPAAGEQVQSGDFVDLIVSQGRELTTLPRHEIRINTAQIPVGETVTVIIRDQREERTEQYISTGEPIVTHGWGSGEVTVRWQDKSETKTFP